MQYTMQKTEKPVGLEAETGPHAKTEPAGPEHMAEHVETKNLYVFHSTSGHPPDNT